MIKTTFAIVLLAILLGGVCAVGAQTVSLLPSQEQICSQFFSTGATTTSPSTPLSSTFSGLGINSYSSYNYVPVFSLAIVGMVLAVLAILYAIGYAFSLPRVITMVRTEYLESVLNIIIIVLIVGGMATLSAGVGFIANLGGAAVSASGAGGATLISGQTTLPTIYNSVCNTYVNDALSHLAGLGGITVVSLILSEASSFAVSAIPNGVGVSFKPFFGLIPLQQVTLFLTPLISGVVAIEVGIVFFLAIVYYLFPIFLFAGILFRSFPWTRAAGGTLIALFIGFYVFFPALVYPFTQISYNSILTASACGALGTGTSTTFSTLCNGSNGLGYQQNGGKISESLGAGVLYGLYGVVNNVGSFFTGGEFSGLLDYYLFTIVNETFQLLGIIIAFVISYSLLEGFADLLGAPSLSAKDMLKKVI
ncbi:MAG: hypothetical protein ACREBF_01515 [Candidatus Micrarchaeales archaeon]